MEITTSIIPKRLKKWDKFVKNHIYNTVFQSPEMHDFYKKVQNFEPFVFFALDDFEEIIGVLLAVRIKEGKGLKGYFSSRVVVYGGPLIEETENTLPVLDKLLKALVITLKNKSIFIQFRNFFAWRDAEKQIFQNNGFIFHNRLNLLVNTDSEKNVWAGLSKSRRRQVRKGLTSGAVIKTPANESEVKSFYHLLVDLYKNKIHKPLPDWSFFQAFYKESQREKLGVIKLAEYKKRIIGGILLPVTPEKNLYEWYVVGMDKEFKKQYPSVLVTWAAIRFALENGLRHFDFMGMGIPGKEYGVRAFKKKFGGQMVDYGRFAMRTNKILYSIAETGYNIIRFCKEI